MNFYKYYIRKLDSAMAALRCMSLFVLLSMAFFVSHHWIHIQSAMGSQCSLFFWGWFSWTFWEYFSHRFLMHAKKEKGTKADFANHRYHHTHPTELKLSNVHRIFFSLGLVGLLVLAYYLQNYFTLVAGFYGGFVGYSMMHVILHQPWAGKVFKEQQAYHIYHHCKYTNRCFGVTFTFWDKVFHTCPPENASLPQRIITFYFAKDDHKGKPTGKTKVLWTTPDSKTA